MRCSTYMTLSVLISLSFGCSTISEQQKLRWMETTPICFSKPDCDVKWAASRQWVQNNSGYKIKIYSDDLIETYNPQRHDTQIAASVTKNPLFITKGEQSYSINIKVRCANGFGCIPSIDESILSFNNYVSNTASKKDPTCYGILIDYDKPHLGFFPMWFKDTNKYIVKRVCSGSPAEKAGLKPNDILLRIGNVSITKEEDFKNANFKEEGVTADPPRFGEAVTIEILRGDVRHVLEAKYATPDEIMAMRIELEKDKTVRVQPINTEERLESLSRMLLKGLITQQEYEVKKKELLEKM